MYIHNMCKYSIHKYVCVCVRVLLEVLDGFRGFLVVSFKVVLHQFFVSSFPGVFLTLIQAFSD